MIKHQLLDRGIKDKKVIAAMRKIPRHLFIEEDLTNMAYDDHPLPIGEGQTISQPYMVAVMTEELDLKKKDRALEIGTGSGYQTAILAEICKEVYTIERIKSLSHKAEETLKRLGYRNIYFKVGDGTVGWDKHSPFDKILVTAGAPNIPDTLFNQLREKGKMIIPIGDRFSQILTLIEKINNSLKKRALFECIFVPLIGERGWQDGA